MYPHLQSDPSVQMVMYVLAVCGLSSIFLLLTCSVCCYLCHKKDAFNKGVTTADSSHMNGVYFRTKVTFSSDRVRSNKESAASYSQNRSALFKFPEYASFHDRFERNAQ